MPPMPPTKCHAVACALIACLTALPCEAAGPFIQRSETGQPRELINQPVCWSLEKADGWRSCEPIDQ